MTPNETGRPFGRLGRPVVVWVIGLILGPWSVCGLTAQDAAASKSIAVTFDDLPKVAAGPGDDALNT